MRIHSLALATLLLSISAAHAAEPAAFPLKDGDTWVMAGDSITAQKLHSNYFEAFCFARYPKLTFRFRNSGIGGDTIPKVMARFDYDVAVWTPTVVSVELGMNDQGGFTTDKYISNMGELDAKIRAAKARPVYFTASPINNGSTTKNISGNAKLNEYAVALKKFAASKEAPFSDQFHLLVDVWGNNKPNEILLNDLARISALAKDDKLAGVEKLREFLKLHTNDKLVSMMGDPVHPGPTGQLTMAAALLKDLGAEPFVSSATISGNSAEAKGCKISDVSSDGGKIRFTRLDECLPFPIPSDARAVLPLYPTILELSQYLLTVKGLTGSCTLSINGIPVGTVMAGDLEKGINLTSFEKGPIADQGRAILAAVSAKEGAVQAVRGASRTASGLDASPEMKKNLATLLKKVEDADEKIREAAKPKELKFELAPAGN